ncbi:hypothetical protein [Nocardioides sp.]|uniref:hypothetical protein n=1 Tax=Nocardioides sp. TaxID=35761 RepID=UPI002ED45B4C
MQQLRLTVPGTDGVASTSSPRRTLLVVLLVSLATPGLACQADDVREPPQPRKVTAPERAPAYDAAVEPAQAVLSLVPQSADVVTVVDWDRVRAQLGVPELTSEDLMTDRLDFWERASTEAVLLTDGLLREESSTFELDYGFTQDDVDWEARWTGEDGPGFVLAFRPDLDLAGVRRAVRDGVGPLDGATVDRANTLLVAGGAETDVWASEETWSALVREPAAATYLHRDCIPLNTALGPDADAEDQQALLAEHPVTTLDALSGFVVSYGDHQATVRVEPGRSDLFERLRMGEAWPTGEFATTYVNGAADPSTGRIGFTLPRPVDAAGLALLEELPFGVCNEVVPIDEPTGL